MANTRNYRVPTLDDDADVPKWNDLLAQDVAKDVDGLEANVDALKAGRLEIDMSGPAGGIVDQNGTRTFLEFDSTGAPTPYSTSLISPAVKAQIQPEIMSGAGILDRPDLDQYAGGFVDADGRELLIFKADGTLTDYSKSKIGGGSSATALVYPSRSVAMFTDSMGIGWNAALATKTGLNVWPGAHGGQTSQQIASRQGGVRALLTLAGNTIPASGPVTVTSYTTNPVQGASYPPRTGTIAGISGDLNFDGTTLTFTRAAAGSATPVVADTEFICAEETYNDRILVVWAYHNDTDATAPEVTVSYLRAIRDRAAAQVKRVMILEACPQATRLPGTPERAAFDARRSAVRTAFPDLVPVYSWLLTDAALTAAGVAKTAQDATDQANGIVPTSLRTDTIHLTDQAKTAVAGYVAEAMRLRGWIARVN